MVDWYEGFVEGIAAGEGTYLQCNACAAATVPPRTICPECGRETLEAKPLSDRAEVLAATEIHVSTPEYAEDTPYTVVLASFEEGVTLTGQLRDADSVDPGATVELGVERVSEDRRILTFSPA